MTTCNEKRLLLGAYALGALDPVEEREVRDHLAQCSGCASEAEDLKRTAELLALLDDVDIAELEAPAPPAPSDVLLPRLLQRVAAERRRRRWLTSLSVAAAALVLGVGAVMIGAGGPDRAPEAAPTPGTSAGPSAPGASTSPAPEGTVLEATDATTGVTMRLEVTPKGWGTALRLELGGVPGGLSCSLIAVASDGSQQVAATWTVPASGYGGADAPSRLVIDGAVGFAPDGVASYQVVATTGQTLVTVAA